MALQSQQSQAAPAVKVEASPAESFLSAPGDNYQSLFTESTSSTDNNVTTMNPMEMMTPQSFSGDADSSTLSRISEQPEEADDADELDESSPTSDKKQTKKRKSWGQVLPEPKTNLPPRKRAKTDDEKEQRRVERVLRNRRAAQSSRERKRLEVEALEQRNKELETLLLNAQKANLLLVEELHRFRRDSGVVTRSSSPLDSLRDNQISLSPELFSSQDGHKANSEQPGKTLVDELMMTTTNPTVNPASLSPELGPVPDSASNQPSAEPTLDAKPSEQTGATSPDLTQRPAEMLCDLPCHTSAEMPQSFRASQTPMSPLLAWTLQLRMLLLSASAILSACQRPLTQIAMSSKAGFSLLPTPQLLTTIIWLVTLPPASTTSTSTTSSTTRQTTSPLTLWQRATMPLRNTASTSRSATLRLKSLRKILSSSPSLARPLLDATMVALRLVSEGRDDQGGNLKRESDVTRGEVCELTRCLSGIHLPSKELLLTLMWALKVEDARIQEKDRAVSELACESPEQEPTNQKYILRVASMRHLKMQKRTGGIRKRYRLR